MTTNSTPAPSAGPSPVAPLAGATGPTTPSLLAVVAPAAVDESAKFKAEAEKWQTEHAKKTREAIAERRKHDAERKTWGEKLKLADKQARLERLAQVDKAAAVRELLGTDKYLQELNELAANGNAPTAASLAVMMEDVEKRTEARLAERDAQAKQTAQEEHQRAERRDFNLLRNDAAVAFEALAAEYPIFEELGDKATVGQVVANNFDQLTFQRYRAALAAHDIDTQASLMRSAMNALETRMLKIATKAATVEKYKQKLAEVLTPPKQVGTLPSAVKSVAVSSAGAASQQQRRSLSNDLTGSSTSQTSTSARNDQERMRAAIAKYHELATKH